MPSDWSFAWQVGAVGFSLVFVILGVLYLVLTVTGWLGSRIAASRPKSDKKEPAKITIEKKAPITG